MTSKSCSGDGSGEPTATASLRSSARLGDDREGGGFVSTTLSSRAHGFLMDRSGSLHGPVPPKPAGQRATPGEWALP